MSFPKSKNDEESLERLGGVTAPVISSNQLKKLLQSYRILID